MGATPRFRCAHCRREVKAFVPRGGDGSMYRPYKHSYEGKPCPGRFDEAEWIDEAQEKKREHRADS